MRFCGNLSCEIAVLQNPAVCGIWKCSVNFNAVGGFLMLFFAVLRYSYAPSKNVSPSSTLLIWRRIESVYNEMETNSNSSFHIHSLQERVSAQYRVSHCIFSLFCLLTAGLTILKYTESKQIVQIYNSDKLQARDNGTSAKANNIYQYGHMLLQVIVSPAKKYRKIPKISPSTYKPLQI